MAQEAEAGGKGSRKGRIQMTQGRGPWALDPRERLHTSSPTLFVANLASLGNSKTSHSRAFNLALRHQHHDDNGDKDGM